MLPLESIIVRLLWAALLGAVIGMERSWRRRPAGLRTGICVSVGAAFFTILSVEIARRTGDTSTTRIASNIVQGIGFLGAGRYFARPRRRFGIDHRSHNFCGGRPGHGSRRGNVSRLGIACLLVLFALVVLIYLENWLNLKPRYMLFRISTDSTVDLVSEVHSLFSSVGIALDNFQVSMAGGKI